jgi:two-component system sensor histidine kinase/response regulator
VIAMTAHAMVEERERCFASGMDGHLAKPIDPAQLYQAIARWCGRRLCPAPAAEPPHVSAGDGARWQIDGLDVADGLKRMLGNRAFYLQMLARFRDGQRGAGAAMRAALAAPDPASRPEAERLAHTLKGVAGQLGATLVHGLAATLEQDIRRGAGNALLLPQIERLDEVMTRLMRALDALLAERAQDAAPAAAAQTLDRDAVQRLIRRITCLLRDYDAEAIDLLGKADAALMAALGSDAHKRVARAARQFDFDAACIALDAGARAAGYDLA